LTFARQLSLLTEPRGEAPKGRVARGSVSPRKMACRARSRGGRLERSKAIDSRHGVARLLPLNFLRLRRAPKEKAPPQRG